MSSAGFHKFKDASLDRIGPFCYRVKEDTLVKVDGEKATRPIAKKMASLDFAMAYAKSALEAYSWATATRNAPMRRPRNGFSD